MTKPLVLEGCGEAQAQVGIVVALDGRVSFEAGFGLLGARKHDNHREQVRKLPELPAGLWLMDTGCGHDLIDEQAADGYPGIDARPIAFGTANGQITTTQSLRSGCRALESVVEPCVLPCAPWVLSVGKRCVEQG